MTRRASSPPVIFGGMITYSRLHHQKDSRREHRSRHSTSGVPPRAASRSLDANDRNGRLDVSWVNCNARAGRHFSPSSTPQQRFTVPANRPIGIKEFRCYDFEACACYPRGMHVHRWHPTTTRFERQYDAKESWDFFGSSEYYVDLAVVLSPSFCRACYSRRLPRGHRAHPVAALEIPDDPAGAGKLFLSVH